MRPLATKQATLPPSHSAMLNAMDPYLYLRHVLERIAEHPINRIAELLPWNVAVINGLSEAA